MSAIERLDGIKARHEAATDVPAMEAALRAVLELHRVEEFSGGGPESSDGAICNGCQYELDADEVACPTVALIEKHLGGER